MNPWLTYPQNPLFAWLVYVSLQGPVLRNLASAKEDDSIEDENDAQNKPVSFPTINSEFKPARQAKIWTWGKLSTKDSGRKIYLVFKHNPD